MKLIQTNPRERIGLVVCASIVPSTPHHDGHTLILKDHRRHGLLSTLKLCYMLIITRRARVQVAEDLAYATRHRVSLSNCLLSTASSESQNNTKVQVGESIEESAEQLARRAEAAQSAAVGVAQGRTGSSCLMGGDRDREYGLVVHRV